MPAVRALPLHRSAGQRDSIDFDFDFECVIEAKGDGAIFGEDAIAELLRDLSGLDPQNLADAVLDTVRPYGVSAPDDMALPVGRIV